MSRATTAQRPAAVTTTPKLVIHPSIHPSIHSFIYSIYLPELPQLHADKLARSISGFVVSPPDPRQHGIVIVIIIIIIMGPND